VNTCKKIPGRENCASAGKGLKISDRDYHDMALQDQVIIANMLINAKKLHVGVSDNSRACWNVQ
jgi:hypothetical protein